MVDLNDIRRIQGFMDSHLELEGEVSEAVMNMEELSYEEADALGLVTPEVSLLQMTDEELAAAEATPEELGFIRGVRLGRVVGFLLGEANFAERLQELQAGDPGTAPKLPQV